jgi:hypothetical protein
MHYFVGSYSGNGKLRIAKTPKFYDLNEARKKAKEYSTDHPGKPFAVVSENGTVLFDYLVSSGGNAYTQGDSEQCKR